VSVLLTDVQLLLVFCHVGREDGGEARNDGLGFLTAPATPALFLSWFICERVCVYEYACLLVCVCVCVCVCVRERERDRQTERERWSVHLKSMCV